MAYIFPNVPPTSLPNEVLKVFKFLKLLPDNYIVWHHLAPWQKDAPDFLILNSSHRALLVKVSNAAASQASPAAQLRLIEDDRLPLGSNESKVLNDFVSKLKSRINNQDLIIPLLILFTNISDDQVRVARLEKAGEAPFWAGREYITAGSELKWDGLFNGEPLNPIIFEHLHQEFSPEVVVPVGLTTRQIEQRRLEVGLKDFLLDYNQEAAVKADLDLPDESELLTRDFRLNIINGVAGSGKTLILLYRLRLLYELYPKKQFLVLTHNSPLIRDIQSRFYKLTGKLPENIEWGTFAGWCLNHRPKGSIWNQLIHTSERNNLIRRVWAKYFDGTQINDLMLSSEIDWYKDQLPMEDKEYLNKERRGRGFRLTQPQRDRMLEAIHYYQELLNEQHLSDWADVPITTWESLTKGLISKYYYDVVLVDEAQFFAPLWFEILQNLVKPQSGHLFVVADPTQGFLGRGSSWKSLGLEARGRSQQLRRSYRTTREILDFASLFYRLRLPQENDEEILAPDLLNMPNGVFPLILPVASTQDEITKVVNEVINFINHGVPKGQLLIIHATGPGVSSLIQLINRKLGPNSAMDPKKSSPGPYIRVTTLNAGAGLESPIVFLVGLHELFEEEQSLRLSDEERVMMIRDHTRKIYMAVTRAGQRLVFTYKGKLPVVLQQCFDGATNSLIL